MGDLIDIEEYKKSISMLVEKNAEGMTEEDAKNINDITNQITETYIAKLNSIDQSFELKIDAEQGGLIQSRILALRNELTEIILELVQELAESSVKVYMLEKYR